MITMGRLIEFEHGVPKVSPVADRVVILIAGDGLRGGRLVRELRNALPIGAVTVDAVATTAAQLYATHRLQQLESELFTPRGLTMQRYYAGVNLLPQILASIDHEMMRFNYGTDFLVAGVDDAGAHLFHITNPGGSTSSFENIGFTSIGSGQLAAMQAMIGFAHTPAKGLMDTIFAVYASKRRAEAAPGVGYDTDMVVIRPEGQQRISGDVLRGLAEVYEEYQRPASQELTQKVSQLPIFTEGAQQGGETV
jgi:20S proteasome alpha/beta subunit